MRNQSGAGVRFASGRKVIFNIGAYIRKVVTQGMAGLEITEVRVRPFSKEDEKLKAFATITFSDCFVVSDLKVIKGKKGLFVAMPSRKRKDGTFKDVAHPLNNETRQLIEKKVPAAYEEALAQETTGPSPIDEPAEVEDEFSDK